MSTRHTGPDPAGAPATLRAQQPDPPYSWAADHLRRILRLSEGSGPRPDLQVRNRTQRLLDLVWEEVPAATGDTTAITDHLWSALLRDGSGEAARFFRPYRAGKGPVLWIHRRGEGADPLARERVEALLERQCRGLDDPYLDPARIHRQCRGQLRNGMSEAELVRVLTLTSPAQAAVLGRLCGAA